jgi:hypothetical protein
MGVVSCYESLYILGEYHLSCCNKSIFFVGRSLDVIDKNMGLMSIGVFIVLLNKLRWKFKSFVGAA